MPTRADRLLERGVVQTSLAVHDHHDPVGGKSLDVEEQPHRGTGQPGPEVRDHDGGHPVQAGVALGGQDSSQSAGTYTGDSTITPAGALMAMGPKASKEDSGCQGRLAVGPLPRGARMAPHNE